MKCLSGSESACVDTVGSECVLLVNPVHAVVVTFYLSMAGCFLPSYLVQIRDKRT